MKTTPHQRLWPRNLQKGDVIIAPSGKLRIVRSVSHTHTGPGQVRTNVVLCIQRKSWTNRPYTVLTGTDLCCAGYRPTKARARLESAFDWAMEKEFSHEGPAKHPVITARDVLGIP